MNKVATEIRRIFNDGAYGLFRGKPPEFEKDLLFLCEQLIPMSIDLFSDRGIPLGHYVSPSAKFVLDEYTERWNLNGVAIPDVNDVLRYGADVYVHGRVSHGMVKIAPVLAAPFEDREILYRVRYVGVDERRNRYCGKVAVNADVVAPRIDDGIVPNVRYTTRMLEDLNKITSVAYGKCKTLGVIPANA